MSFSSLTRSPAETTSLNVTPVLSLLLCVAEFLFSNRVEQVHKFLSRFQCSIKFQYSFNDSDDHVEKRNQFVELSNEVPCSRDKVRNANLRGEEAEMVVSKMGIHCHLQEESSGSCEILNLFDDEEPSVEEVKEAFDVFDENKDGFIDETDLQRVLCALGFKEGLQIDNCRRMINAFDANLDQKIDFGEFFKLMENTLC